ncbi:hypothetical protein JTB14_019602 [Gonioctena quinquepunctata]|nr:hypothetical protein JTB14_019602 [Gonioctena quinquepunctata]
MLTLDNNLNTVTREKAPSLKKPEKVQRTETSLWMEFEEKAAKHEWHKSVVTPATSVTLILGQYIEMPLLERTEDPLEFWKAHKQLLRELYRLSVEYLCIPATYFPSERVFPKRGQLTNIHRNRLEPKNLDNIIFLNGSS